MDNDTMMPVKLHAGRWWGAALEHAFPDREVRAAVGKAPVTLTDVDSIIRRRPVAIPHLRPHGRYLSWPYVRMRCH